MTVINRAGVEGMAAFCERRDLYLIWALLPYSGQ